MSNLTTAPAEELAEKADDFSPKHRDFYRVVWRWHFYAGLFVIPFMLILSVTGIIYLFKPQLDALMYRNLLFVTAQSQLTSADEQLRQLRETYPASTVKSFTPPASPDRSSQFDLTTAEHRHLFVFVNPYDAQVLGAYDADRNLQNYAVLLHGELMIGRIGDCLIELAACWTLVLMISGLYMWFPRTNTGLWGMLLPRLNWKSRRVFWRDLHSVIGFYGSLIVVFMILTGLFWSGFWGETFANVWSGFPKDQSASRFKSSVPTGSLNTTSDKKVAWAVEPLALPESNPSAHEHTTSDVEPNDPSLSETISLENLVGIAHQTKVLPGYSIVFPRSQTGVFTISAPLNNPLRQATLHVDRYSGAVLADVRWQDYATVPRAVTLGISLHEGLYFGWLNQLLMLFASLTVFILAVSGTVMWWRRRPANRLGAPPMPKDFPLWKTAVGIIGILGLVFPLVGLSLVTVLLVEYFILRCVPKLREIID